MLNIPFFRPFLMKLLRQKMSKIGKNIKTDYKTMFKHLMNDDNNKIYCISPVCEPPHWPRFICSFSALSNKQHNCVVSVVTSLMTSSMILLQKSFNLHPNVIKHSSKKLLVDHSRGVSERVITNKKIKTSNFCS